MNKAQELLSLCDTPLSSKLESLLRQLLDESVSRKILCVDDDEDVLDFLSSALGQSLNCVVLIAQNRDQAEKYIEEADIVITDYQYLGRTWVVSKAKELGKKVIMFSGSRPTHDVGVDHFVEKPEHGELIRLARQVLNQCHAA